MGKVIESQIQNPATDLTASSCIPYSDLLERAAPILERQKKLEKLHPPSFNIFNALGHAYREVSTHSAMLSFLCDPCGGHAQQTKFLNKFIEMINAASRHQQKEISISIADPKENWKTYKEFLLSDGFGQADVVIDGPNLLLLIENKIWAQDQPNQLQRYWEFMKRNCGKRIPILVYLTPSGREPSSISGSDAVDLRQHLILLSYRTHIYNFITESIAQTEAVSVGEVLRMYAELVRSLT